MTAVAKTVEVRRARASQRAITAAFAAMKTEGLPVDKVCINGGQIEIHVARMVAPVEHEEDAGLKDW